MVCVTEDDSVICQLQYETISEEQVYKQTKKNAQLTVRLDNTVAELTEKISKIFSVEENGIEIFLKPSDETELVPLTDQHHKLSEIETGFKKDAENIVVVREVNMATSSCNGSCTNNGTEDMTRCDKDDDLLLGASASPTVMEGRLMITQDISEDPLLIPLFMRQDIPYVGLVNQAMTCYLNSLLQALFMTPEFRNALYNWEFDGNDPAKSIPYQLQKLFLNLQTSTKSAVETTELTRSFGWDLSEAWQQHDIQELCRVMFDALEQKFKDTEQADLINRLYQGKMIDYVKCLECKTEKSREDTFLDIPLPVRPFGSCVAYGSVEEALRAFVQPETLDGNNQYFCDKCNKKCDAHKGLKFTKIPYLLTLHLKRFDFDYSTMHRIKLNDKVTFPETLDLNSFITSNLTEDLDTCEEISIVKCDDSSTTDSGSALDDESCQGTDISGATNICSVSNHQYEYAEDDEGIDMSSGATNMHENEKNRRHNERKGPYVYELFSIMIHSGSASGGHYYAYIKDFKQGKWYCFDDQSVSRVTHDDIRKTYGGGPNRTYYSGAYSSSTNAYMLMYRQIDSERNVNAMTADEFPKHIKDLLHSLREREESDRINKEREMQLVKMKLYVNHPVEKQMIETKLILHNESTFTEATEEAYRKAKLENIVPIEQCRLVSYNRLHDTIECSFDGQDDRTIADIIANIKYNYKTDTYKTDWLLEIRNKDQEFVEYKPGGINLKVYVINIENDDVEGPFTVRGYETQTWLEFKSVLAKALQMNEHTMKIALDSYINGSVQPHLLENENEELIGHAHYNAYKIYVSNMLDEDPEKPFIISKFHKIIDKFEHIISLDVILPVNDKWTLKVLSIPPLDLNQNNCEKTIENAAGDASAHVQSNVNILSPKSLRISSTQVTPVLHLPDSEDVTTATHSDQSNSEDSSLSDSDRTLVGDAPDECLAQLSSTSNSPAGSEQHLSSPEEPRGTFIDVDWEEPTEPVLRCPSYYFKATEIVGECSEHVGKTLKILVDKRTNLAKLKKELESYVGVPMEYFKIYRQYTSQEIEWSRLTDTLSLSKDGEKLIVKLGRVLKENEHAGKVYQLIPNATEPIRFLCDWVVAKGETVGHAKKELLESIKKQYQIDIPYNRCRLRKKNWKSPNRVYLDDQKFVDDITLHTNWEMFVQELDSPEVKGTSDQVLLFVRQWCPSTLELKPFHELLLDEFTVAEFKEKLSAFSGIPVENVEFAILKGTFPYEMSVLGIQTDLEWNPNTTTLNNWPLNVYDDGHAFLFRDNREQLKQLTNEERKEICNKETSRMGRFNKSSLYSPRRERALKIYLDTSPKKSEDPDVD